MDFISANKNQIKSNQLQVEPFTVIRARSVSKILPESLNQVTWIHLCSLSKWLFFFICVALLLCFGTFWLSFQPGHLVVQYVFVSGSFSSSVQLPPKVALMFCDIHFHQIWWVPKIFTFFLTFDPWAHSSQNGLAIKASHLNWLARCDNGPQGLFYWKTWTLNQDLRSRSTEKEKCSRQVCNAAAAWNPFA